MIWTGLKNCIFTNWEKSATVLEKAIETLFTLILSFIDTFDSTLLDKLTDTLSKDFLINIYKFETLRKNLINVDKLEKIYDYLIQIIEKNIVHSN